MAFNPNDPKFKVKTKHLPVLLLLDVSGSMYGDKIETLYDATVDMINAFSDSRTREVEIKVAIITFGKEVCLHTPFTPAGELRNKGLSLFNASGMTPLGTALRMVKEMIEDKTVLPPPIYKPAVVLVSDGEPNDSWEGPLKSFISEGRSMKCQRFAVGIGKEAKMGMLQKFADTKDNLFYAEQATEIAKAFQFISNSVSQRSRSTNPDQIPIGKSQTFDNNAAGGIPKTAPAVNTTSDYPEGDPLADAFFGF